MDRATVEPKLGEPHREKIYCEQCRVPVTIQKQRRKAAVLDCGHIAVYEEDSGTWDVI